MATFDILKSFRIFFVKKPKVAKALSGVPTILSKGGHFAKSWTPSAIWPDEYSTQREGTVAM
jgi:hypothetical protein